MRHRWLVAFVVLTLGACAGQVVDSSDDPTMGDPGGLPTQPRPSATPGLPGTVEPPGTPPRAGIPARATARPLRRLSREEYLNTVRDLFPGVAVPAVTIEPDVEGTSGFLEAPDIATTITEDYMEAAEAIAAKVVAGGLPGLMGCDPAAGEAACVERFVGDFGQRAFRRPLTADDRAALQEIYATARGKLGHDVKESVRVLVAATLQSPRFLYHTRAPALRAAVEGSDLRLDSYELASRLSYLLWRSMPDAPLFAAAAAGKLATDGGLTAEAMRLLTHERARPALAAFHLEWLNASRIRTIEKDGAIFKDWSPALAASMAAETSRFVTQVVAQGDGKLGTLLGARFSFVDEALAKLYGIAGVTGKELRQVELPAGRAGLLTQGTFLATSSNQVNTNPMRRGNTILTQLLCRELPPPPADAAANFRFDETISKRKNFEQVASTPACAGCHRLLNATGFALDHFDAIGRQRTMDGKWPIDASGRLELDGKTVAFDGSAAFLAALADSAEVRACFARQWARHALARREAAEDEPLVAALAAALDGSGGDLRALLGALVVSRPFRYRTLAAMEVLR